MSGSEEIFADDEALAREAEYLHRKIFDGPIPEALRASYVAANRAVASGGPGPAVAKMALIVERALDVEALELALRRRERRNSLTAKLLILLYLAEARGSHFHFFVNEERARARSFCLLALHALRSLYKLLKGAYLIRKHGIV
jgi:hypothetical protein